MALPSLIANMAGNIRRPTATYEVEATMAGDLVGRASA